MKIGIGMIKHLLNRMQPYMLDINSKGTVSIKVIRNTEGEITGVSYMTEEEIAEILERAVGNIEEIPVINTKNGIARQF